jgi:hypothetical protein
MSNIFDKYFFKILLNKNARETGMRESYFFNLKSLLSNLTFQVNLQQPFGQVNVNLTAFNINTFNDL